MLNIAHGELPADAACIFDEPIEAVALPDPSHPQYGWFLCDSAISLLVAGVDTLGGREGEPWRAVRRSARSARRARSYRLAKLSYERG